MSFGLAIWMAASQPIITDKHHTQWYDRGTTTPFGSDVDRKRLDILQKAIEDKLKELESKQK